MHNGLVSVVLPIYKTEKYLDRCITSIVNQTYKNLEILLIDDGSPDGCPQMCEEWASRDNRIKVIHKANAGLGMARNTGIENAAGEYICFFDSDDYLALDTIEKTYQMAKEERSDIVLFGFSNIDQAGNVVRSTVPQADKVTYSGEEVQSLFLPDLITAKKGSLRQNLYMSACMCLYSMLLIQRTKWRFVSEREIISEDVYSLLCLYKYVDRVSVLQEALYFYCENGTSLTHTYRKERFERICHFHETSVNKARELGYSREVIYRLQEPFLSFVIAALKMITKSDCSEREKKKEIKKIVHSDYLRQICWSKERNNASLGRKVFSFFLKKGWFEGCYLLLKLVCK